MSCGKAAYRPQFLVDGPLTKLWHNGDFVDQPMPARFYDRAQAERTAALYDAKIGRAAHTVVPGLGNRYGWRAL